MILVSKILFLKIKEEWGVGVSKDKLKFLIRHQTTRHEHTGLLETTAHIRKQAKQPYDIKSRNLLPNESLAQNEWLLFWFRS